MMSTEPAQAATAEPLPELLPALGLATGALLAGCGGGAAEDPASAAPAPRLLAQGGAQSLGGSTISAAAAARFLAQASMGASRADIAAVQSLGYAGWLDAQFAMAPSMSRWDWLVSKGYNNASYRNTETGFDN